MEENRLVCEYEKSPPKKFENTEGTRELTYIMTKNLRKKSQAAQFQSTTSNIPFYCLEEPPIRAPGDILVLVEERDNVEIGLADHKIRYVEKSRNTLERKIGLDRSVDPLNAVHLEIFNLSRAVLRFELSRLHNSRQGTTCSYGTCQCNVRCRNVIQ